MIKEEYVEWVLIKEIYITEEKRRERKYLKREEKKEKEEKEG